MSPTARADAWDPNASPKPPGEHWKPKDFHHFTVTSLFQAKKWEQGGDFWLSSRGHKGVLYPQSSMQNLWGKVGKSRIATGRCLLTAGTQTKRGFPKAYIGESFLFSAVASGAEMLGSEQRGQEEKQHL